jgi:hypothetical protein
MPFHEIILLIVSGKPVSDTYYAYAVLHFTLNIETYFYVVNIHGFQIIYVCVYVYKYIFLFLALCLCVYTGNLQKYAASLLPVKELKK